MSNSQFEQCDSVLPPSPCSSPAMTSMEMQIQRTSWWCHGRPRGFFDNKFQIKFTIWTEWLGPFDNQFQIKFTIWTVWLGPSSFTSLLASDDVNGDAAANAHPMQRDSARFGHSVEIFFLSLKYLQVSTLFFCRYFNVLFFVFCSTSTRQARKVIFIYVSSVPHRGLDQPRMLRNLRVKWVSFVEKLDFRFL